MHAGKQKDKAEKKEARKAKKQEAGGAGAESSRRAPPTAAELAGVGAYVQTGCAHTLVLLPHLHNIC